VPSFALIGCHFTTHTHTHTHARTHTAHVNGTLDPEWNETIELKVSEDDTEDHPNLLCKVRDLPFVGCTL